MTCEAVDELLLDYVEGELPEQQAEQVRAHLRDCDSCAAKAREMGKLLGDLAAARTLGGSGSSGPVAAEHDLPRLTRIGDFEIIAELGRGGMGVVYRARQLSLNRVVALKLLSTRLVDSERSVTRFLREAKAAARLHHTNIVPIYAQGRAGEYIYYAMELIEGPSLDALLRELRRQQGQATGARSTSSVNLTASGASAVLSSVRGRRPGRDFKRVALLVAGVAEGLHHAHEQGVVHRDIKPQNLLLGPDEQLHITDFGLARILDEPSLTRTTEMLGTPAYMAPEQITGPSSSVDRRTDVYALGVTLYELLTLRRPFEGESYEQIINQILKREPPAPRRLDPRIPQDLETICLRAMEKEPQRRFATAGELAAELRRYAEGFPIASRPLGPLGKALRWVKRHPWQSSALGTMALLLVAIPLLLGFFARAADEQVARAYAILLENYRERQRALEELGWMARVGGDSYRLRLVEALAWIRGDPQRSAELLSEAIAQRPDDPDGHYLLAWAYARQTATRGAAMWADAQREIALGDAAAGRPSAAGFFFRGQAVWGLDPHEAERSFDQAIRARTNFTQAMLHQGRAMNQIMYLWRDISYYRKAVARLESVTLVQPDKAYPRYVLALTHLLAGEILTEQGHPAEAQQAYEESLAAARDAQMVEPGSPRGYAAEADYYESRGDYRAAVRAWQRFDNPLVQLSTSDRAERYSYEMRLRMWLGEFAEAEQARQRRFDPACGYDPRKVYDGDETFYAALLAGSLGQRDRGLELVRQAAGRSDLRIEDRLLLDAAARLLGAGPLVELLSAPVPAAARLSPGWTPAWAEALRRYALGELSWQQLQAASERDAQRLDSRLRMTAALFYRGVYELAAGDEQALQTLHQAAELRDNENYCFRARLLERMLRLHPDWAARLRGSAALDDGGRAALP